MKKIYVSLSLEVIAFDETDAIRTSGVGATVSGAFTETDADFNNYFGEGN